MHDKESSHNAVIRELELIGEPNDSRAINKLPKNGDPLARINRLCLLLKLFLDGYSEFGRSNFPGWLDLFSLMMNPPKDRMEKVALVLNRAMAFPKTLRYRSFYKQKPR